MHLRCGSQQRHRSPQSYGTISAGAIAARLGTNVRRDEELILNIHEMLRELDRCRGQPNDEDDKLNVAKVSGRCEPFR